MLHICFYLSINQSKLKNKKQTTSQYSIKIKEAQDFPFFSVEEEAELHSFRVFVFQCWCHYSNVSKVEKLS